MKVRYLRIFAVAAWITVCLTTAAGAEEKYKNFEDARRAGMRLVSNQQLAEAQEPLEAALRLAPDDKARLNVYQALVPVYRMLPEIDKKIEADEFLITHTERRAGRSLAARDLVSFLHQRGKLDAVIQRYEARLKDDPKDHAALAVLATAYAHIKRDAQRADEFGKRLEEIERDIGRSAAGRLEKEADTSPQSAASLLKDAAQLWLEAGEKAKALAAAKRSASSAPEARNDLLTFYWRDGLGDVFLATAAPKLAVEHFEAALAVVKIDSQRKATEKKLAAAKEAAALQ